MYARKYIYSFRFSCWLLSWKCCSFIRKHVDRGKLDLPNIYINNLTLSGPMHIASPVRMGTSSAFTVLGYIITF